MEFSSSEPYGVAPLIPVDVPGNVALSKPHIWPQGPMLSGYVVLDRVCVCHLVPIPGTTVIM